MPMYKGQKYEYDKEGLAAYHKAKAEGKKTKPLKGMGHMPLDEKQAKAAIKNLEQQKKDKKKKKYKKAPLAKQN